MAQADIVGVDSGSSSSGWMMQDPRTGAWVPIENGNTQGNVRGPDGTVYSNVAGLQAYQASMQQQTTAPAPEPAPAPAPAPADSIGWDSGEATSIIGRPLAADEEAFYSQDPNWRTDIARDIPRTAAAPPTPTYAAPPPTTAAPPPTTAAPPKAPPAPGSVPNPIIPGVIDPYPGGAFQAPEAPKAPAFVAPTFTEAPAYTKPTAQEAASDPGYQFAQQQGQQGVERSAAARGVLNTGGTLQDIAKWNQALATTQYQNVADRSRQDYLTNYTTQYLDPYKQAYQGALDTYNTNYKTQYQEPYENAYQAALQQYQTNYQAWLDRINQSKELTNL